MHTESYVPPGDTSLIAILERFCHLPDPVDSAEQAERRAHLDLADLDAAALRQELAALCLWLPLQRSPDPWFLERVTRLRGRLRDGR